MTSRQVRVADVVTLVANKSSGHPMPHIDLEDIESGTGKLRESGLNVESQPQALVHDAGDVLFSKLRPYLAKSYLPQAQGSASGEILVMRPSAAVDPRFFLYLTLSAAWLEWAAATSYGSKMPRSSWAAMRELRIALPRISEQRRIADFLDEQTRVIDTVLAQDRTLIELAGERTSVLFDSTLRSRGVNVPGNLTDLPRCMPSGWQVMRLSQVLNQLTNGYVGATRNILRDSGVRYIQGLHIKGGSIDFARRPFYVSQSWHDERPRIHLRSGDVLVVQTGDIGQVAVVPEDFGAASCHALQILRVRPEAVSGKYLGAYLASAYGKAQLLSRATGALHPHLEGGIRSANVIVPPLSEQTSIVSQITDQGNHLQHLEATVSRKMALLAEKRYAVISAAVTGALDVATARSAA